MGRWRAPRSMRWALKPRKLTYVYCQHMRMHIELEDTLIAAVDEIAGHRRRSAFVREAVRAAGSIPDAGHDWDDDPAEWMRNQCFGDTTRVG